MLSRSRDRSRPRVNGTTQYEHMLLQPLMTDTKADTSCGLEEEEVDESPALGLGEVRTGLTSAYVSSKFSWTLTALSTGSDPPAPRAPSASSPIRSGGSSDAINRGRSLYASGPAIKSAVPCLNISSLSRSAMHPKTPTTRFLRPPANLVLSPLLKFRPAKRSATSTSTAPERTSSTGNLASRERSSRSRCHTFSSAPSRMAHVLVRRTSASNSDGVSSKVTPAPPRTAEAVALAEEEASSERRPSARPWFNSMERTMSESFTFI
mmetsp:Transcript_28553/g.84063  ORF Transcript_28553/g.84063 Transcript_28553/m.84063 type:complete len:265 (+) Transcript_28553:1459-2253(+)